MAIYLNIFIFVPSQNQVTRCKLNINETDRILCSALQRNGRAAYSELAELVGLSVPAVRDHILKLEQRGVIKGYHVELDQQAFDLDISAYIFVRLEGSDNFPPFILNCKQRPEILECHAITGEASHLLKVKCANTSALEKILSDVQQWPGVRSTRTNLVLSTHMESMAINTELQVSSTA